MGPNAAAAWPVRGDARITDLTTRPRDDQGVVAATPDPSLFRSPVSRHEPADAIRWAHYLHPSLMHILTKVINPRKVRKMRSIRENGALHTPC